MIKIIIQIRVGRSYVECCQSSMPIIIIKIKIILITLYRGYYRFVPTHGQTVIELSGACAVEFFRSNTPETQTQTVRWLFQHTIRPFHDWFLTVQTIRGLLPDWESETLLSYIYYLCYQLFAFELFVFILCVYS